MAKSSETRSIELEVTIDAPVEAVWDAISQGEGLKQWFPPDARVDPGPDGRIWLSWGPGMEGEGMIDAWEPNKRLAWRERSWGEAAVPVPMIVDFELEGKGGSTIVRLVHSGWGKDAQWDEQFDATRAGWTWFLFHLQHYLERHGGEQRRMVFTRRRTSRPVAEVWDAVLGEAGLDGPQASAGNTSVIGLGDNGPGRARITFVRQPHNLGAVLESLNDGLLFIEMEPGSPDWHCGVWISLYGVSDDRAQRVQSSLDRLMERVIPAET